MMNSGEFNLPIFQFLLNQIQTDVDDSVGSPSDATDSESNSDSEENFLFTIELSE